MLPRERMRLKFTEVDLIVFLVFDAWAMLFNDFALRKPGML